MKTEIIPACMPMNLGDLEERARIAAPHVQTIQIDIMDGVYVPDKTWPFFYLKDFDFEAIKEGELSLPLWESVDYELDLMVTKPEERIDEWLALGPSRIILHFASVVNWDALPGLAERCSGFVELGLAVTIHDDRAQIEEVLKKGYFDFVQVMGIDHIGYSGEPFDERSLDLVDFLHERFKKLPLSLDGGVSEETIPELRDRGVTRFVSGSHIFNFGIPEENIELLSSLASGEARV